MSNIASTKDILNKIREKEISQRVRDFFDVDVASFNQKMNEVDKKMQAGNLNKENACSVVFGCIRDILTKGQGIEKSLRDRVLLKSIKQAFREQIMGTFIKKSLLVNWGYSKPSGFPGDFKLIEMLYDNKPISEGVGFCGDSYILQDSYVEAVRIRKDLMEKLLIDFVDSTTKKTVNILNIGSGSGREIKEAMIKDFAKKEIIFSLIDWDKKALDFNRDIFRQLEQKNSPIKFRYFDMNVLNLYKYADKNAQQLGPQDLIYSIGLADYLTDTVLGGVISFSFGLLQTGGQIMIAHKNVKVKESLASDWFCDWRFLPRNQDDLRQIIADAARGLNYELKFVEEETQHIFFAVITKK